MHRQGSSLVEKELGQSLVHHLFLPHQLPSSADNDYLLKHDHQNEHKLIEYLIAFFASSTLTSLAPIFNDVKTCLQRWLEIQNPKHVSSANLQISFQRLIAGDFLPLYFHAQNAAILIEIDQQQPSQPLISAWQVLLPNQTITSSIHSHLSCFPPPTFRLSNLGQLYSPLHCEAIVDFFTNPIQYPQTNKASYGFDETRNVPLSHYVCEWWMMVLNGVEVKRMEYGFKKKHRDHIRWSNAHAPFRRSGLWMTIKVVLQTILMKRLGNVGRVMYKMVIASLLTDVIYKVQLSLDLLVCCTRKIVRRLEKIESSFSHSTAVDRFPQWMQEIRNTIGSMMRKKIRQLNVLWAPLIDETHWANGSELHRIDVYQHSCEHVQSFLNAVSSNVPTEVFSIESLTKPLTAICNDDANYMPSIRVLQEEYRYSTENILTRVEIWIEYSLERWIKSTITTKFDKLFHFYESYQGLALSHYYSRQQRDPVGYSRFILASLTILRVMHQTMCADPRFETLKNHAIRIPDLLELFEYLVLPDRHDTIRARQLYNYFHGYRRKTFPDLLDDITDKLAFGIHYAETCESMKVTLRQIRTQAEEDRERKKGEFYEAKRRCEALMERAYTLTCQCDTFRYVRNCERCDLISQANGTTIGIYECPIPQDNDQALAVVFELQMPIEIRVYRDILWQFINRPCPNEQNHHVQCWLKVSPHSDKLKPLYQSTIDAKVQLVSGQKSISQTHYANPLKVMSTSVEKLFYENSFHVQISPNTNQRFQHDQEYHALTPVLMDDAYKHLEYTLQNTVFRQNQVIADLSKCSMKIQPRDHIEFGSFRSGHRLQWWNLLALLEMDILPLDQENVILLIQHALCQNGPVTEDQNALIHRDYPESHQILLEDHFVEECRIRLVRRLNDCEYNWQNEHLLLLIVTITMRMATMCQTTQEKPMISLIRQCRQVGQQWIGFIEKNISIVHGTDLEESLRLREKVFNIALSCILTYGIDQERSHWVIESEKDLFLLHHFTTTMRDIRTLTLNALKPNLFIQYFSRIGQCRLITFQPIIHRWISQTSFRTLSQFAAEHWSVIQNKASFHAVWKKRWTDVYDGWYDGQYETHIISMDTSSGAFLIDGKPIGFLPESITRHPLFQCVFKDQIFEVQNSSSTNEYVTKHKYHDNRVQYRFRLLNQQDLLVTEHHSDSSDVFQLIPPDCLRDELPIRLVSNYKHWNNIKKRKIHFRPNPFKDKKFIDETSYILDLKSGFLTTTSIDSKQILINQSSNIFHSLFDSYFCFLDDKAQVEMFLDFDCDQFNPSKLPSDPCVRIYLPRLGLAFNYYVREELIRSREYIDMYVDPNQSLGTLVGLRSGLLLSPLSTRDQPKIYHKYRKFIVPYGELLIDATSDGCKHVNVQRGSFPHEYFVFILNDRLRILQVQDTPKGSLYLALLHATTSNSFPDSYTGMTGMERAFQLLNSAACHSDEPYDEVSLHILRQIASISPKVKYYPEHLTVMECIDWHQHSLPASLQHFGYYLMAKQLLSTSTTFQFMHPSSSVPDQVQQFFKSKSYDESLLAKLYWAYRDSYNPIARLSSAMEEKIRNKTVPPVYEPVFRAKSKSISSGRCRLADGLYASGDLELKDSSKLDCFPLSKWLDQSYQWRNIFIGLLKRADELRKENRHHNNTIKQQRFDLLLDFLQYIHSIESYYFQVLKAVAKGSISSTVNITYPPFISYQMIEHRTVQEGLLVFPRKANATRRGDATKEVIDCFNKNLPYNNECVPERGIDKATINRQLESWRNNRTLMACLVQIDTWLSSAMLVSLPVKISVHPQEFQLQLDDEHYTIRPKLTNSLLNPVLLDAAKIKFLRVQSENLVVPQTLRTITDRSKPFPEDLFPSTEESSNTLHAISNHFKEQLRESWRQFQSMKTPKYGYPSMKQVEDSLTKLAEQSEQFWNALIRSLMQPHSLMYEVGLLSRLVPTVLITELYERRKRMLNGDQSILLGGIIVNWIEEQRLKRALNFALQDLKEDFQKELVNVPHVNWIPSDHLPWLLLELEMNITIREVQIDVARHMIEPKNDQNRAKVGNAVMQMNMGEGKTSVILPMLALALSSSSSLVRLILLKSLLPTNYQSLRHKLGGLLNRRVLIFRCHRQMSCSQNQWNLIFTRFQRALTKHDIILSSPEDLLSFDLLTLDQCRRKEFPIGRQMLSMQCWMRTYVRDILDESDEILHVKYQLVYTVGSQQQLDGSSERWKLIQLVLNLLRGRAEQWQKTFPEDIALEKKKKRSQFAKFRLLSDKPYQQLCMTIADDWLKQQHFRREDEELIRSFVLDSNASLSCLRDRFSPNILQLLLVLRGLLSAEVLLTALKKRYRVNYGINPNPSFNRLMAVPFRAKDVAAERTEFGHIDVALVLTQLSYYYAGLTDSQLWRCFENLSNSETDPPSIYDEWLSYEDSTTIPSSIRQWTNVNIRDYQQRTKELYPMLRHNISIINYFLNHFVYPREAKQFPHKFVASPWDLTSPPRSHVITGFSGTNDTQLLLPPHICQCDLVELRKTDAVVLNNLLRKENDHYQVLPEEADSHAILSHVLAQNPPIQVILDVGALFIDASNRNIAMRWLQSSKKNRIDYAIYFDSDQLFACDRQDRHHSFLISPANERLDRCVIYLDEIHTRGTDFKFPPDFRAALTLGNGLTKDRFVQAAMRMRQLGHQHFLSFFASHEVHQQILNLHPHSSLHSLSLKHILRWVYNNTLHHTWDGFHHWATQSLSYQRKAHASRFIQRQDDQQHCTPQMMQTLARDCLEPEVIDLKQMYGPTKHACTILQIYRSRYEMNKEHGLIDIHEQVLARLTKFTGSKTRLAHLLDEEQEKELEMEQEQEEERQIERPPPVSPAEPIWHETIRQLCQPHTPTLDLNLYPSIFHHLPDAFKNTTFAKHWPRDAQNEHLWITTEFQRVIETQGQLLDPFLRPPRWILIYHNTHCIFLSPFEADRLMAHLHHLYRKKPTQCPSNTTLRLLLPRTRQHQSIFVNTLSLIMPPIAEVKIPVTILSQLFVFNGTVYFENDDEEKGYCEYLGLCPKPRTRADQEAFDRGDIDVDGFIVNETYRNERVRGCRFKSNPIFVVKKLLENRSDGHPSMISHVAHILFKGVKIRK